METMLASYICDLAMSAGIGVDKNSEPVAYTSVQYRYRAVLCHVKTKLFGKFPALILKEGERTLEVFPLSTVFSSISKARQKLDDLTDKEFFMFLMSNEDEMFTVQIPHSST